MAFRSGVFIILLAISWTFADATSLGANEAMGESKIPVTLERNEQLCTLCEEYSALATKYLKDNKTETEIVETLHRSCSQLHSFEQQCVILVDYYSQLFFKEVSTIQPEEFCRKVHLCKTVTLSLPKRDNTCVLCHQVVLELLAKLKNPDSQMEIIQTLLKECNKMDHYSQECKRLVFQYGPLILANGEKFLESTDICASIHACKPKPNGEDIGRTLPTETRVLDA